MKFSRNVSYLSSSKRNMDEWSSKIVPKEEKEKLTVLILDQLSSRQLRQPR